VTSKNPALVSVLTMFAQTHHNHAKDINRCGAGVNYYIHGQNLKWTMQYLRVLPASASLAPGNEFGVQLQLFYY
jgi:hypothetical protein